jgi:phenol hydroxylase P5 protein
MAHELTIEPLGVRIEVEEDQTILDAALRHGIYLPHACGHGLCGTCKIEVRSGEVDIGNANPFALMDFEREEGKALACCATLREDTVIEADIEEEPDARIIPVRDFEVRVSRIWDLTPTIKGVRLVLDAPLDFQFQAGQYIQLAIPGLGETRAFSIANSPAEVRESGEIELNIRRVPGGMGTGYVHERLAEGQSLSLSGPYGRFFVRKSARLPMIFMAGGSGLSSCRSMIRDLLEEGCTLPITLIYGQRNRAELYYDEELRAWARDFPNFTYVPALSEEQLEGGDVAQGFVHEVAERHFGGKFAGHKAYLCGPPLMIEAAVTSLMRGRLFERDIYFERFISAADVQRLRSPLFKKI